MLLADTGGTDGVLWADSGGNGDVLLTDSGRTDGLLLANTSGSGVIYQLTVVEMTVCC